jgi:fatty acid kinase fatty acid binding subunit
MVKIVTDSSSDVSPHLASELGITVIPVRISFGAKVYYDGIDMDRSSFYQQLSKSAVLPTTEPPLPGEFQHAYSQLLKGSDQILSIHSSSKLNRTSHVAQEAARSFLGRGKITVVDSRMISWGLALVVSMAAEAANRGASADEIVRLIRGMVPHIYMVFFVENLDYLERRGHPGRGRMPVDGLPGVRPLLIIEDGEIVPMERVRSRGKSIDRLFEFVTEFARFEQAVILQGRMSEDTQLLFQRLTEAFPERKLDIRPYGPALATHLGSEALGVAVYEGM